jgi:hypothetical protein
MASESTQRGLLVYPGGRPMLLLFLCAVQWGGRDFLDQVCFLRRFLFRVCVQPFHLAEYENLGSGDLVEVRDVPGRVISYLKTR